MSNEADQHGTRSGSAPLPSEGEATVLYVPDELKAWPPGPPADRSTSPALPSIPGYEVLEELGRGGTGVVYKARQIKANRVVALKMILAGSQASSADLARFHTEAEAIARLQHAGIVQVYEVGEWHPEGGSSTLPFFSLEFCPEGSLAPRLDGTPLPPRDSARLIEQLAEAIHHAHQAGIVHRDLKPANILLQRSTTEHTENTEGKTNPLSSSSSVFSVCSVVGCLPKITDFSLAKMLDSDSSQTRTGSILGTPSYMAPEQAAGGVVITPAVDIYALGVILYECLTGRPPFRAVSVVETIRQLLEKEPVPVRQLQPSVPRDLETITLKCLEKEPDKRYTTARELADDLGRFLAGEPIRARPVGALERGWKWARRHRTVAGLLLAVVVVAAVGLCGVLWEYGQAVHERNLARKAEGRAREERDHAQEKEQQARETEERTRRAQNASQVALSEVAWREGQPRLARARLDEVPVDLRRWEWFYLDRLYVGGLFQFSAPTYWLHAAVFSPEGDRLASAGSDGLPAGRVAAASRNGTLQIWDARTGIVLHSQHEPRGIHSLAWSPDGTYLATAGPDIPIRIRDGRTLAEVFTLPGAPRQGIECLCFTPDGQRLICGGQDGKIRVWDLHTRQAVMGFHLGGGGFSGVSCSPGGQLVAGVSAQSKMLGLWELRTGRALLTRTEVQGRTAAFSPDGRRLAWFLAGRIVLWDCASGAETASLPFDSAFPSTLTFSPDGQRLAAADQEGKVRQWDLRAPRPGAPPGAPETVLQGVSDPILSLCFSPDGQRLAASGADRRVFLWDTRSDEERLQSHPHLRDVAGLALSSDGQYLACSSRDESQERRAKSQKEGSSGSWLSALGARLSSAPAIHVLNGEGDTLLFDLGRLPGPCTGLAFQPRKPLLASSSGQVVQLWDLTTRREVGRLQGARSQVHGLAFSPDGRLLAGGVAKGAVLVWDLESGQSRLYEDVGLDTACVAFSPDGRLLAAGSADMQVRVWDVESGELKWKLEGHQSGVKAVAFSPDGRQLATGSADTTIRLWDATSGAPQLILEGYSGPVTGLAYTPDGERLFSSSVQRVKVWDPHSGLELVRLAAPVGVVQTLALHPDNRRLLCGGQGGVWSWLALPTRPRLTLRGHTGTVLDVAFSPSSDGSSRLASGGADHTVRLWDPVSAALLRTFRGHAYAVRSVGFGPDAQRIVSYSRDNRGEGEIRVWDVSQGQVLHIPNVKQLQRVAFSADGKTILGAGGPAPPTPPGGVGGAGPPGGPLRRWDAATGRPITDGSVNPRGSLPEPLRHSSQHQALILGSNIELIDQAPLAPEELAFRRQATLFDERWHQAEQQRCQLQGQRQAQLYHLEQLLRHGGDEGSLRRLQEDAARRFAEEHPESVQTWALRACFALSEGDVHGYRDACAVLVKPLGEGNPDSEVLALRTCSLAEQAGEDLQRLLKMSAKLLTTHPTPDDLATHAALLLQAGKAEEALPLLEQARHARSAGLPAGGQSPHERPTPCPRERLLLALACTRLQRFEEARRFARPDNGTADAAIPIARSPRLLVGLSGVGLAGAGAYNATVSLVAPLPERLNPEPLSASLIERLERGILRRQVAGALEGKLGRRDEG